MLFRSQAFLPKCAGDTNMIDPEGGATTQHKGRAAIHSLGIPEQAQLLLVGYARHRVVAEEVHGTFHFIKELTDQNFGTAPGDGVEVRVANLTQVAIKAFLQYPRQRSGIAFVAAAFHGRDVVANQGFVEQFAAILFPPRQCSLQFIQVCGGGEPVLVGGGFGELLFQFPALDRKSVV